MLIVCLNVNLSCQLVVLNAEKMCVYKHSIQLHKLYNSTNQSIEWLHLNTQQNFNSRVTKFLISNSGKFKIGNNILTNRLTCLNNKIELDWLNLSLNSFKIHFFFFFFFLKVGGI